MNTPNDTIVAPATAAGGAIAVVRMSGPSALAICDTVFSGARRAGEAAGYTVLYGTIADGARVLDDVLVTVFRAPHSYTGEDAVEISCHGSRYIVRELLALLVRRGARMATPGEFTSRAFLGGKLDLSQAEAVADLIASGSRAAHTLATDQMRGGYSAELETLRGELLRLASLLELELDFGEEEVEFADRTELRAAMERIGAKIDRLIDSFALGNAIKEGVAVAIVGRPNVGKSTLLNRLLNEERALVSEIPGTTRDPIEATLNLNGILYRFIDTAGTERAYASVARAQIVLQVFDAADPAVESLDLRPDQCRILVANKIDRMDPAAAPVSLPDGALPLSAREGRGMELLLERLRAAVDASALDDGRTIVSNSRHYEALHHARTALDAALGGLETLPSDLLGEEIRQAIFHLGTITGEITTDEVLGQIFSKFCIGK